MSIEHSPLYVLLRAIGVTHFRALRLMAQSVADGASSSTFDVFDCKVISWINEIRLLKNRKMTLVRSYHHRLLGCLVITRYSNGSFVFHTSEPINGEGEMFYPNDYKQLLNSLAWNKTFFNVRFSNYEKTK